jgi:predicted dehydrogenase
LRYPDGISFAKTCANERGGFARRQLVICGEQGTIELRPLEEFSPSGQIYTTSHIRTETSWHAPEQCERSADFDRYDAMMQNFAEMVCGKENPYTYDYELNLYKLILKACGKEF